jgi:type IV secretory pathway VirB2 component (pilin)
LLVYVFFVFTKNVFAATNIKCNKNDHCYHAWYCVGGVAENGDTNLIGKCVPSIVLKQLCNMQQRLSGRFSRVIALMAVLFIGWSFLKGEFQWSMLVTTLLGIILLLAPFQVLFLVIQDFRHSCDFIAY